MDRAGHRFSLFLLESDPTLFTPGLPAAEGAWHGLNWCLEAQMLGRGDSMKSGPHFPLPQPAI